MGGKRRRINSEITISLFSFQDIITCLSGIMILLVLLITVDIVTGQVIKSPHALTQTSNSYELLKKEIEELKNNLLQSEIRLSNYNKKENILKKKLIELEKRERLVANRGKSISFIPAKDANPNQRAILIECSEDYIRFGKLDKSSLTTNSSESNIDVTPFSNVTQLPANPNGIRQFIQYLENFDKLRDYPVFIIKPSASDYAMELINQVQSIGFDVGYDAMAENESVENINNYQ
ncbi:MAG: hypothetical protein HQK72_07015 [Desulfamplus sp.]|nr:hypothetical protein [Desulfamplus sp.]